MALRSVWSASVLGVALLNTGVAQATDPPPACVPAARLQGEGALIAPIRASLQARGVAEGGAPDCQRLEVRVMPSGTGYDLFLTDAEGRTDRRQIARAETAAMVIESWLQADLGDPLLDRRTPAPASMSAPTASMSTEPAAAAVAATLSTAATPAAAPPAIGVWAPALGSVRADSAVDRGTAVWWGTTAGACLRVGRLCAGPQARFRASAGPPGLSSSGRALDQLRSFEGGLALEAPLALGRVRLLPGIFLGAGRLSGRWHPEALQTPSRRSRDRGSDRDPDRRNPDRDGRGDRDDRDDRDDAVASDEGFARTGLRAGAGLGLALPLGPGVAIELHLSAGVRPVAPDTASPGRDHASFGLIGHAGAGLGLRIGAL